MKFGENLKLLRKNNKISQEVLADKIGVTRQSVSKWEVGDAYPEMSNIIALCAIFHCNINDLINDNIVDIELFDNETKEGIVKFKKKQQKRMKWISKSVYFISNIIKFILAVPTLFLIILILVFPFVSKTLDISENRIKILNNEFNYSINDNMLNINGYEHYIESRTNIKEFISGHDNKFFVYSIEYILVCNAVLSALIVLAFHLLSKLYKNIYNGNTPFTLENEKLICTACLFLLIELVLQKLTALIYSWIANVDLAIDLNIKDLFLILVGISIIYIFKYGRMIQVDTKSKIYD